MEHVAGIAMQLMVRKADAAVFPDPPLVVGEEFLQGVNRPVGSVTGAGAPEEVLEVGGGLDGQGQVDIATAARHGDLQLVPEPAVVSWAAKGSDLRSCSSERVSMPMRAMAVASSGGSDCLA